MAFVSLKDFLGRLGLGTPEQFDDWSKAWRVAAQNGSQESLLSFICRERGVTEEQFLQMLAQSLNWPYLDLPRLTVPQDARNRISTKVAFQYSILPTQVEDGTVEVAVSNPFDTAMLNAVRFDARGPVRFALAPKAEIEKALKKYYGVGAETLEEMGGGPRRRKKGGGGKRSRSNYSSATRKLPKAIRKPVSSSSSIRSSGTLTR